jgi:2-methylisocitrate lyase-like PEP mutase family enzyme
VKEYLTKLSTVIEMRKSIFVIARTDATDQSEAIHRAVIYAENGADGIMVEAIKRSEDDLEASELRLHANNG